MRGDSPPAGGHNSDGPEVVERFLGSLRFRSLG